MLTIDAPPLPEGYTAVKIHDAVAFVPQKAHAVRPVSVPSGYVACKHPEAGMVFFPERLADGVGPSVPFGMTADGMPDPIIPTVVKYGDSVAFVPATAGAVKPAAPPSAFVAYEHPLAGTVYLPERLAPGGRPSLPYGGALTCLGSYFILIK